MVFKAHQRNNAILRCFVSRNITLLLRAYLVYVRPLLEYNSTIWSPHYSYDIDAVERVQRRFTKRLPGLSNYTYNERLSFLNIPTLEQRRMRADLILCYKIFVNHLSICSVDFFETRTAGITRGHPYKLYKRPSCCFTRSSFFERIVNAWNNRPVDTDFSSPFSFKRQINRLDWLKLCY